MEDTKKTIEIEITGRETGTSRMVAASASAAQTIDGERGIMKGTAPDMTNRGKRPTTVIVKERRNGKIPTVTPTTDLGAKMAMTVREARVLTLLGVDEVVRIHEAAAGILLNAILLMEGRGETKVGEREITSPWTGERLRKVDDDVKKRERWEWCTTKMGECTILEVRRCCFLTSCGESRLTKMIEEEREKEEREREQQSEERDADDPEAQIAAMMGFGGFNSTKVNHLICTFQGRKLTLRIEKGHWTKCRGRCQCAQAKDLETIHEQTWWVQQAFGQGKGLELLLYAAVRFTDYTLS